MFTHLFSMTVTLFILMNPIGNIPLYSKVLSTVTSNKRKKVLIRELCIALTIMILFIFIGRYFLALLTIDLSSVLVSGAVILFIIAIKLVFPKKEREGDFVAKNVDPLIVPLAIPFLADPALLASLMHYAHHKDYIILFSALFMSWVLSFGILITSEKLGKLLGNNGIAVIERIMGLILILMSIQLFFDGLSARGI